MTESVHTQVKKLLHGASIKQLTSNNSAYRQLFKSWLGLASALHAVPFVHAVKANVPHDSSNSIPYARSPEGAQEQDLKSTGIAIKQQYQRGLHLHVKILHLCLNV